MKIKSIKIINVRGLQNHFINLNMIPNKPSILVAPNGSGKTSFAFAFQWLNKNRIKLNIEDAYNNDTNNLPELIIETTDPDETLKANNNQNDISKKFNVMVINSGLQTVNPKVIDGHPIGKAKLAVSDIVIMKNIPDNVILEDDFNSVYDTSDVPSGTYPMLNSLLSNNHFMSCLDSEQLKCNNTKLKKIAEFIEVSLKYEGTREKRLERMESDYYNELTTIPSINYAIDIISKYSPDDSKAKLMVKAVKLVTQYYRKKKKFDQRVEYSKAKIKEEQCKSFFASLKTTWKNIQPHREENKLILKIDDAQRISNGERDSLNFLANLYKATSQLTKEYNILIIDEVFDYLDDANMMAVQYYITSLIKQFKEEGRYIFPIILSHLNPDYYNQHFSFKDAKVYYLCPLPHPHASENMEKLLRKRSELSKAVGPENEEDISKYMLHFHSDYTKDMTTVINTCPTAWGNINNFKHYCFKELELYLDNQEYDPLAVCVYLREIIEKYVYNKLSTLEQQEHFLKEHGTANKLKYAEDCEIDVPELFYLLGNIYNDPMHINNKSQKSITQTLYSRLENNTIREMIRNVYKGEY